MSSLKLLSKSEGSVMAVSEDVRRLVLYANDISKFSEELSSRSTEVFKIKFHVSDPLIDDEIVALVRYMNSVVIIARELSARMNEVAKKLKECDGRGKYRN